MFHSFRERDQANLDAICAHITRHFEPVSLSDILDALDGGKALPDNAITVTVDDGYRNFLLHGHPLFRRHKIPATVYAVAGFCAGRLWLWPDQIEFGFEHTTRRSIRASVGDVELELSLQTPQEKTIAAQRLTEALKRVANDGRLAFLREFGSLCGVEIPPVPPSGREAMSWDELRAVAAEGVEIGCHTETHPILSRLSNQSELDAEIRGAKAQIEEHLGFKVRHFCYPNGRAVDIGEAAIRCVKDAGYASAVSGICGLNTIEADPFQIRRLPFDPSLDRRFCEELLVGLHKRVFGNS